MMGSRTLRVALSAMLLSSLIGTGARSQVQDKPVLQIVEPTATSFLIGNAMFKANVLPEGAAVVIEFFVDGTLMCRAEQAPFECSAEVGEKLAVRTVRVVATLIDGGRLVSSLRTSGGIVDTVDVSAVLVPFVVTDYLGRFVKGLNQSAFRVLENGTSQNITFFQSQNVPLDLVLVVDISESMTDSMAKLKSYAQAFLGELDRLERSGTPMNLTVMAFNERSYLIAKPEAAPAERNAAIAGLKAGGRTSLYDAILRAINLLGTDIRRKALIVFTDGDDSSSLAAVEPVENRLRESDATLYLITQGKGAQMDAVRRIVNRLAERSGGRPFSTEKIDELQRALSVIMDDLANQYLLGYAPNNVQRDGTYRTIEIKTNVNSHNVRARTGYRAPAR